MPIPQRKILLAIYLCVLHFACHIEATPLNPGLAIQEKQNILEDAPSHCPEPSPIDCSLDASALPAISINDLCSQTDLRANLYKLDNTLTLNPGACPVLDGQGITLIAPEGKRHFNINGARTIQNITLACGKNTNSTSAGGSIAAQGTGTLVLRNVQFYRNQSYGHGGALATNGIKVESDAACFYDNKARKGGAVYLEDAQSANFQNTDFKDNATPGCGDGIVDDDDGLFGDFGEECDDGDRRNHNACVGACQNARCGDGYLWETQGSTEQCDDGNLIDGDDCDSNCTPTACGNGIVTAGEECDFGASSDPSCIECKIVCAETDACNTGEEGECTYAEQYYRCDGTCVADADTDGVCDELERTGCQNNTACNYDSNATDPATCIFPSGCDNTCGSTLELDECGVCGGGGIPQGQCDCNGNVDAGCGCGLPGPSGCDNTCGSTLELDECGVCNGPGLNAAGCCGTETKDCLGTCGGSIGQAGTDSDGDGVLDCEDNCLEVANSRQIDSDCDGFGNRCDGDLNNSGAVNVTDHILLSSVWDTSSWEENYNPDADMMQTANTSQININDFIAFSGGFALRYPGPSIWGQYNAAGDFVANYEDFETRYQCSQTCGNGTINQEEQCDDGNLDDDDGCSSTCQIEGIDCTGTPYGDAVVDACGACAGPGYKVDCDADNDGIFDHEDTCMLTPSNESCDPATALSGLDYVHGCSCAVPGCTDPNAENYNPQADLDDGSCCAPWEIFIADENGEEGTCYEAELAYLNVTGDGGNPYRTGLGSPYGWGADWGSPWPYGQAKEVGKTGNYFGDWTMHEVGGNGGTNEHIGAVFTDKIARHLLQENHPAYFTCDNPAGQGSGSSKGIYGGEDSLADNNKGCKGWYYDHGRLDSGLRHPTHFYFKQNGRRIGPFFQESAGSNIDMYLQSGDNQYLGEKKADLSASILNDSRDTNPALANTTTHWNHVHHVIYYMRARP